MLAVLLAASAQPALAEPTAPTALCRAYPDLPDCAGRVPTCALCHTSTDPVAWNAFGEQLAGQLTRGQPFEQALPLALAAVADDDADGDGATNLAELRAGRSPSAAEAEDAAAQGTLANPGYRIGAWDPRFTFRRVSALYCGRSPSYEELSTFAADSADDATLRARVHEKLSQCLRSPYWRSEGLLRLADKRIKPVTAFGADTDITIGGYRVVIGDFRYDYDLWAYALTDDHDMREMLTAQYHVTRSDDGTLRKVEGVIAKPDPKWIAGGQPVPPEQRAGLLTTQWTLAYGTMFSAVPRVTAAQAYRAYLGADIANMEGLRPVPGEPVDIDNKGVADPRCAQCHATLDPLSYAFAEYEGVALSAVVTFGSYDPSRPSRMIPAWNPNRQKSVLLDKPVKNLVEWAAVAVASDEFKRTVADMFFQHALHRGPTPSERAEFDGLWRSCEADGYSADRMLHRLIDTLAFGSP